jgi:hypothetical protein
MDLDTIQQRVSEGFYDSLTAFREDLNLVWDNAMIFNPARE